MTLPVRRPSRIGDLTVYDPDGSRSRYRYDVPHAQRSARCHPYRTRFAGKLMARKRPHLIPAYDQVIACLLGNPNHVWQRLHHRLAVDGGTLRDELAALRTRTKIPATVSLLRVLDVVLWTSHHNELFRATMS
jgi:hypothetical protein